jgi:hypothetical protein
MEVHNIRRKGFITNVLRKLLTKLLLNKKKKLKSDENIDSFPKI